MGTSKETTTNQAGAMSPEAQRMLAQLANTAQGNQAMQDLASGQLSMNQQDQTMVNQAQQASGDLARQQMERNMQMAMRQSESQGLERGIDGSSLEAVNNALIGQNFQNQLGDMAMQQQGQSAQQMLNMPFQRAGVTMNANQLLMNRLVQGAQVGLGYDQGIRQLNQTSTTESPSELPGQLLTGAAKIGTAIATGGASIPADLAAQIAAQQAAQQAQNGPGY